MTVDIKSIISEVDRLPNFHEFGQVASVLGMLVEVSGIEGVISIGDHCAIQARNNRLVPCEVIGFRDKRALVMPFGTLEGIGLGCPVEINSADPVIYPDESWLGRVINAFGEPIDGKGPLRKGATPYLVQNSPPQAHTRQRVGEKIDLGVRVMNAFLTVCKGQRMGVFAGSGVGKSTILSMMARHTEADTSVIGLIGERGREAREFIEDDLGEDGMSRSVVIVATSDEPPLVRRQAAYLTMAVAEFFRDLNRDVLCLMDSVTRFAMAQREISLSAGEPPATRGYTPTVFAELPRLLERAGPGAEGQGSITGLFTVLVEGDDHNEPVSDAVRGILDGHVVLDRTIAERGRYPAVNILRSVSRTMPACNSPEQNTIIDRAKHLVSVYEDMAELIRLGAYRQGSDPQVDEAIHYFAGIEEFLRQNKEQSTSLDECYANLAQILDMNYEGQSDGEPSQELQQGDGGVA
ncbi:MAG: flagellar protein export ATPase FliI [Rhodospirillaceae bacterium]|nr:flagellar protein export ATPase FliI [Rhodospirillaceae bacterium]MBT4938351.1 flagellar protein export ATPase FliI [Rhodospirillaceae bacterium]MBT5941361.1 flagellar protein export ATPase FliI [Rhodospirillaceae bacterium]MBT7268518.1 flagellar protein export ATPase FliI [Rhodospirillaceae bacterium]